MNEERLLEGQAQDGDAAERAMRPTALDEFIGQRGLCENLKVFVTAARKRESSLDHVLLYGPPGLGKTTLAQIVAREMGVNFHTTSGPILTKAGDLAALLTNVQAGDVLFIDEIHRLSSAVEEVLYPAMEDFKLDIMIGEGPAARSLRIDLPPFTLVGATTRLGLISNPLRDRFGIPLRLQFYSPEELAAVVMRGAGLLKLPIAEDGVMEIAKRSRGTPRIAVRLLRRVRDFAEVLHPSKGKGATVVDAAVADHALQRLEVDGLGLDGADRRYMRAIAEFYNGGPVGVETLAAALSEQRDSLEETIEPYLIQIGFVQRTPRGRMLTAAAFGHLGLVPPRVAELPLLATVDADLGD